jgi:membrane fusion protein (multidrug efflux system)
MHMRARRTWHDSCWMKSPGGKQAVSNTPDIKLVTPTAAQAEANPSPAAPPAAPRRSLAKILLPVLVAAAALAGGVVYWAGRGHESTDDSQVEGHVASVAARVSGQVKRVLVKDNQPVKAGDVLVELDDRDFGARLAAARADRQAAQAGVLAAEKQLALAETSAHSNLTVARGGMAQASALEDTTQATIEQSRAEVTAAQARLTLAESDLHRAQKLIAEGAIPRAEMDARQSAFDQAGAALAQARARQVSAEAGLGNARGGLESSRGRLVAAQSGPVQIESARAQVEVAQARLAQADAAVAQAELNLSYTVVRAEIAGTVARRTVEPGQTVSPERPLMALVDLDDVWVVANFKEDQLGHMHAGQRAEVRIDTFGARRLAGHVESFAPGTGSRFSLLPPDNASGNFTKVVQRVPVLVRLDRRPEVALRPGLSAAVTVAIND